MTTNQKPTTGVIWVGLLFMLAGAIIILISADIIRVEESLFNAPRWVVGLTGLVFFNGGIAASLMDIRFEYHNQAWWFKLVQSSMGFSIFLIFTIILIWIGFGPGERQFSSEISIPLLSFFSTNTNEVFGRMIFGIPGLCLGAGIIYWLFNALLKYLKDWVNREEQ